MLIPRSPRLRRCAEFVAPGDRVADVGTDHGYLGIYLLQQGLARSVIASDIAPGPLSAAKTNAEKYGFSDKMEFCLSDGVRDIPRDFDTLVCAGMGADTMIHILSEAPWLQNSRYRLVLQCQSKQQLLRRYLSDQSWCIASESALRDGRFIYTVMEVRYQPDTPQLTDAQCWFPPVMQKTPSEETREYYRRVLNHLGLAASHGNREAGSILQQLEELPW